MAKINNYPLVYKLIVCKYYFEHKGEQKVSDIIKLFKISNGSLYNWINKYTQDTLADKKRYTKNSKYTPEIKCFIREYIIKHIDFDYKKLIILIKKKYKLNISKSSLYDIIKHMSITRKKFKSMVVINNKTKTKQIKQFKKQISKIPLNDIICIDETSIDTHTSSNYGWSIKGTKITKIHKQWRSRYTIISAISNKQVIYNKIIKGSSNAIQFNEFLVNVINNLKSPKYLLMDNARIHHAKLIVDYMKTTNHKIIYNVPCCPEYNPIELVFSKFKSLMRKKDNSIHSKIIKNIMNSFKKITRTDLTNFYNYSLNF